MLELPGSLLRQGKHIFLCSMKFFRWVIQCKITSSIPINFDITVLKCKTIPWQALHFLLSVMIMHLVWRCLFLARLFTLTHIRPLKKSYNLAPILFLHPLIRGIQLPLHFQNAHGRWRRKLKDFSTSVPYQQAIWQQSQIA